MTTCLIPLTDIAFSPLGFTVLLSSYCWLQLSRLGMGGGLASVFSCIDCNLPVGGSIANGNKVIRLPNKIAVSLNWL